MNIENLDKIEKFSTEIKELKQAKCFIANGVIKVCGNGNSYATLNSQEIKDCMAKAIDDRLKQIEEQLKPL